MISLRNPNTNKNVWTQPKSNQYLATIIGQIDCKNFNAQEIFLFLNQNKPQSQLFKLVIIRYLSKQNANKSSYAPPFAAAENPSIQGRPLNRGPHMPDRIGIANTISAVGLRGAVNGRFW